jgi:hypothetical protein
MIARLSALGSRLSALGYYKPRLVLKLLQHVHNRAQALWPIVQRIKTSFVHNPTVAQEHHSVGIDGRTRIVGHDDDRLAQFVARTAQQAHDRHARPGVEIAGRFIGQHNHRLGDQCARQRYTLLLAAG